MRKYGPLLLILILAIGLRTYQFGSIPYGLNRDEAAQGYNAYSILKTGRDEYGRWLPLRFESFGDWKQPVYTYLLVPIVGVFGLSEVTVRLPALIAGVLMIVGGYYLARAVVSTDKYKDIAGIAAALLIALNPWHFHLSRIALEAMVAAAFLTGAGVFLIQKQWSNKSATIGVLLLVSTLFTYHGALIVVPLWFLGFWVLNFSRLIKNRWFLSLSFLFMVVVLLMFRNTFFSQEAVKAQGVVIFDLSNEEKYEQIYSRRTSSPISVLVHNQPVYTLRTLITNYMRTFSPKFLLTQGGNHPSFNVPGFGNFFWPEVVLAGIGLIWLGVKGKKRGGLIIIWFLIAPLAGAITRDAIHSAREIFMLPVVQVLAGIGVAGLVNKIKLKPVFLYAVVVVISIGAAWPFYRYYFSEYKAYSDHIFHGYFKDVVGDIDKLKGDYDSIVFTNPSESPYIFYAFYSRLDPITFQKKVVYYEQDKEGFRHVKKLDQIQFRSIDWEVLRSVPAGLPNDLVIMRAGEMKDWMRPIRKWDNLDGEPELVAVETKSI